MEPPGLTVFAPGSRVADEVDVVVLAALAEEMRPLRVMLADVRRLPDDKEIWRGRWGDRQVGLVVTGDGERNAREGAAAAFRRMRARAVVAIGVAGALSPELVSGDLLVAHRVMRLHGDAWQASPAMLAAASRLVAARPAALLSIPRIAATRADKRRLAALVAERARGLATAVDLESATFAAAAGARGLPWLVLRGISDDAGEELPALLNECLDEGGAMRRGRLAARLFGQPAILPRLLSLRQRVRTCAESLAAAVLTVLPRIGDAAEERQAAET